MLVEGVGPAECFGLPRDPSLLFSLLQSPEGRRRLSFLLRKPVGDVSWKRFDAQIRAIERCGAGVVTYMDDTYPPSMRDIPESPAILFYRGKCGLLEERGVAIVGSRRASARGVAFTRTLAGDIAGRGIGVTSGAALGIDAAAHRGALARQGKTVAVLGTGLDVAYPAKNAALLEEIALKGCVVSEQLMGTPPLKFVFPRRNRLISGFSQVVVVVEAGERSGALISARWALEQGRDVGAVPGFPGDPRSRGSNRLLKTGAFPVESVEDILEAVPLLGAAAGRFGHTAGFGARGKPALGISQGGGSAGEPDETPAVGRDIAASGRGGLSGDALEVLQALTSSPVEVDVLARHLELPAPVVQRALLELELCGLVERDRSGLYSKP